MSALVLALVMYMCNCASRENDDPRGHSPILPVGFPNQRANARSIRKIETSLISINPEKINLLHELRY